MPDLAGGGHGGLNRCVIRKIEQEQLILRLERGIHGQNAAAAVVVLIIHPMTGGRTTRVSHPEVHKEDLLATARLGDEVSDPVRSCSEGFLRHEPGVIPIDPLIVDAVFDVVAAFAAV